MAVFTRRYGANLRTRRTTQLSSSQIVGLDYFQNVTAVSSSNVVTVFSTDESVPGPLRNVQTVRHILCRVVVTRHRGRGRPREVIVQHASESLVVREPDIFQRLIETRDRTLVHLLVQPVAAVHPDDRGLITISVGVGRWPTECLPPVRGKALGVLRVVAVAERMANHLVL